MRKLKNRNIFLLLTIILSLGITLGAVYFMYQYKDSRENELKTSMISLNFTEKSEVINLSSNVPMIDDLGLKSRPYEFTITNTSTVPVKANITLDVDKTNTTMKYGAVRYAIFINDKRVIKDYVHRDNLILYEYEELQPNQVLNCKLVLWVDYYYDYPGEVFKAKVKAEGVSIDVIYKEATFLPGPEFNVKIKELAGTDTSTNTNGYEVIDNNIIYIKRAKELPNNITFTDDNILSTSDSEVPIYGWFDNGTLYYYTFAKNPYMNSNAFFQFGNLKSLENIEVNTINTSKTTNMKQLFYFLNKLKTLDVSNFDTSNVTTMQSMFYDYKGEILDVSNFNTSKVTNMWQMFLNCTNVKYLDVSRFDTSKVTLMTQMFQGCSSLKALDLSSFNTSNVTSMRLMFAGLQVDELDLTNFNTRKVTNISSMFSWGEFRKLDISSFELNNVTDITDMFTRSSLIEKLKTPKVYPNNLSITLPKTLYDNNHNAYTILDSTSPTETWLKSE